ncbi:MAG: O-antigen polysaccharide polymerase Wzy family protein [Dorea sp.]|nr:O-antigen polysaccharide polymerase Wzy family protein [Dorea sp.]MCI9453955.1 O-antigen polysaccharide polymerase Wzy family protein [Dorea sp.]
MRKNRIVKIENIFAFFSLIIFGLSLISENNSFAIYALLIMHIVIITMSICKIEENLLLLLFEICILVFLSGGIFYNYFSGNSTGMENKFSKMVLRHILICLYLSQLFVYIGYCFFASKWEKRNTIEKGNKIEMLLIQKISFICFLVTIIPKILIESEKARIIKSVGYVESYLGYSYNLSSIVLRIGQGYTLFYWIFLLTKPSRKRTFLVLGINLFISFFSLRSGKRSEFILPILMIIVYLGFRDREENRRGYWLKKYWLIVGILLSPVLIVIMQWFSYFRLNIEMDLKFTEFLKSYFDSSSAEIIGYGKLLENQIPKHSYTFGLLWMVLVRNQSLIGNLLGLEPIANQTIDMALNGNSLGQTITYFVNSSIFFRGGGMGSCFIADAYQDFSYFGVIGISLFYGILLFYFYHYSGRNIYIHTLIFLMIEKLFLSPRESSFVFISSTFSLTNLIYLFGFMVLISLLKKKGYGCRKKGDIQ